MVSDSWRTQAEWYNKEDDQRNTSDDISNATTTLTVIQQNDYKKHSTQCKYITYVGLHKKELKEMAQNDKRNDYDNKVKMGP